MESVRKAAVAEVRLLNGFIMPMIGLGTYNLSDKNLIVSAIKDANYRHIDTANMYGNEATIG